MVTWNWVSHRDPVPKEMPFSNLWVLYAFPLSGLKLFQMTVMTRDGNKKREDSIFVVFYPKKLLLMHIKLI